MSLFVQYLTLLFVELCINFDSLLPTYWELRGCLTRLVILLRYENLCTVSLFWWESSASVLGTKKDGINDCRQVPGDPSYPMKIKEELQDPKPSNLVGLPLLGLITFEVMSSHFPVSILFLIAYNDWEDLMKWLITKLLFIDIKAV